MATYQIDDTKPYRAANGHQMVAPIYLATREGAKPFTIWSEAYCVATCRACGAGDRLEDFAGESEYGDDWGDAW